MGCSNCSSSSNGLPKGCKNNGSCGINGCDKMTVFDWLANMEQPGEQKFDIVEVRFKNGRKEFYRNLHHIPLYINDIVAVESSPGHDIGSVSLSGELVRVQLRQKGIPIDSDEFKKLYRKANQRDIDIWKEARDKENSTMLRSREIAAQLGLEMKISDVEYQGDGNKATFFYTADNRVDFRELIKRLASDFRIRVEMRQIGARQEAGRLGGIGSCGRELCCATWLTDFRSVNTAAARYQQLSLNPQKLAGQCGKLKCCLNYELDTYVEALKEFPKTDTMLHTAKGEAMFQKMDIFKRKMWYSYREAGVDWIPLDVDAVNKIIAMNKKGEKPQSLEDLMLTEQSVEHDFGAGIEEDSLTRFDKNRNRSKKRKRKKPQANANSKPRPGKKNTGKKRSS